MNYLNFLNGWKNNPIVESLVFKQDSYYKFVFLSMVIHDIEMFYSEDKNGWILAAGTMYNLWYLWVTYTSYLN